MWNLPSFIKILFFLVVIVAITPAVSAQDISVRVPVFGSPVEVGHIVSILNENYILAIEDPSSVMYGVVVSDPVISIEPLTALNTPTYLVSKTGELYVKVTAQNGNIAVGDYITVSKIPGVGIRSNQSGAILGRALEEFSPENPNDIGLIRVNVNITSAFLGNTGQQDLLTFLKTGALSPFIAPLTSFRYILAALVAFVSLFIGFSSFSRLSHNSVEALGRNPLAGNVIRSAVVLNFIFTFGILVTGLVISYLILTY